MIRLCLIYLVIALSMLGCGSDGSGNNDTSSETTDTAPETTDPESNDSESTNPESTDPESTDPESTDPESTDPESTDPESTDTVPETDTDVDTLACAESSAVHVDGNTGTDDGSCGASATPCATIGQAIDVVSGPGAICVHEGTYNEGYLQVPSDVWLISVDGVLAAKIFSDEQSAVRFQDVNNAGIDGFEVYGSWNQGPAGDGLIRVYDATNITIKNTMAHDAPYDQDVVKVSGQVSGLLIDRLVAWNPAFRSDDTHYQEVIDVFGSGATGDDPPPVSDVVVRNCWLFHEGDVGDWLIYSKIYAENIIYENNVFGPSAGHGWSNPAVGIGTGEAGIPNGADAVVNHSIVRNNIFVGLKGDAAFTVMNADDTWVYNNTFYENSGDELRAVIMLRGNSHEILDTRVFNNIFVNNNPSKSGGAFFWLRDNLPDPWFLDNNLYYNNIAGSDIDYTQESSGVYGSDPGLDDPSVPDITNPNLGRIEEIKANFAIGASSSAVDQGIDSLQITGHPNWNIAMTNIRWDYLGEPRPAENTWDLGADEVN